MKRILLVAKNEVLEHRRQPAMLFAMASNYLTLNLMVVVALFMLNASRNNPQVMALIAQKALEVGVGDGQSALEGIVKLFTWNFGALLFTTLPLFTAIFSAFSVLNDRLHGTMPFLMLAPLSRYQLLLGKVFGALAIPYLMHLVFVGLTVFAIHDLEIMAPFSESFGGSTAWWLAFVVGSPAGAFLVGSIGTVISGLSKDVRTSMHFTSYLFGFLSVLFGYVLFDQISRGAGVQIAAVILFVFGGLVTLLVGSKIISRDIT